MSTVEAPPCPRHPDEKATRTCARCATPGCYLCARNVGSEVVCLRCRSSSPASGPPLGAIALVALLAVGALGAYVWKGRAGGSDADLAVVDPGPGAPDPGVVDPAPAPEGLAPVGSPAAAGNPDVPAPPTSPAYPPTGTVSTGPQRVVYQAEGVAFTIPAGCEVLTRAEGPSFAARVQRDGKALIEVVVLTVYPWIRTGETLNANGPYVESNRAQLPGQREVAFGGERWSFRPEPNPQLFLYSSERIVFVRTPGRNTPWEVGGPELEIAASFEWLELPPLRERARQRHGLTAEQAAAQVDKPLLEETRELVKKTRKLGALPPSVLGAVQWSERDDITTAEALLLRDFLRDVLGFVQRNAEAHPR